MIEIKNITKSYNQQTVLNDLSLNIDEGSVLGLVGENGCGKTTLLHLLNDALKPDKGEILYDGLSMNDVPEIKRDILLIGEDQYFKNNDTLNTLKDFYQVFYDFNEAVFEENVLNYQLPVKKPINSFSKGMKRQAMLCIALAIAPKYLFLDEAFDGLDPIKRVALKKAICELISTHHTTVIIASHNLRELEDICDHYCILHNGKLLDAGILLESESQLHKIQLAFKESVSKEDFKELDLLSYKATGKVVNLIVRGEEETINEVIASLHPVMKEILPVNLEELFIYEIESKENIENV